MRAMESRIRRVWREGSAEQKPLCDGKTFLFAFAGCGRISGRKKIPKMSDRTDHNLLQSFAAQGDEESFRVLVGRYSGFIFGTAMRRLGDAGAAQEIAQEIAQDVFAALARKAGRLDARGSLAAWLHRAAMLAILDHLRRSRRRAARHLEYENTMQPEARDPMESVRPHLDEALDRLCAADRDLLMLHFAERLTFPQIAARNGGSADAARMRATRALETLATMLRSKGVVIPAVVLGAGISSAFSQTAPAALAAALTPTALAGAGKVTATTVIVHAFQTANVAQISTIAALVLAASVPLWWQHSLIEETRERLAKSGEPGVLPAAQIAADRDAAAGAAATTVIALDRTVDILELARAALLVSCQDAAAAFRLNSTLSALDTVQLEALAETIWSHGLLPKARDEFFTHVLRHLRQRDLGAAMRLGYRLLATEPDRNEHMNPQSELTTVMREWTLRNPAEAREWFDGEIGAGENGSLPCALRRAFVAGLLQKDVPAAMAHIRESSVEEMLATLIENRHGVRLSRPAAEALTAWALATFTGERSAVRPAFALDPAVGREADGTITKRTFLYEMMIHLADDPAFSSADFLQTLRNEEAVAAYLAARFAAVPRHHSEVFRGSPTNEEIAARILDGRMRDLRAVTPQKLLGSAFAESVALIEMPAVSAGSHLSEAGGKFLELMLATSLTDAELAQFATSDAFRLAHRNAVHADAEAFGRASEAQVSAAVNIRDTELRREVLARVFEIQWPASAWMLQAEDLAAEDRAALAAKHQGVAR